ncbi:MAG TPA: chemotaxis protein CheW [Polyangiaceae bacterium]|nr:chemotaxis protein CheW [Polyangiaceae bacterium]
MPSAESHELITSAPLRPSVSDEPVREILTFALNGEAYGVPLTQVLEILGVRSITRVPRSPEDVVGVCTVRGELVTVIDTRRRLEPRAPRAQNRGRILVTSTLAGEKVGLLVDEVLGVQRFSQAQIEPTAGVLVGDVSSHIESIARKGAAVTVLVNLASLTS